MGNYVPSRLRRSDLLYPELCYQITGLLFDVHDELGYGHKENVCQRAVSGILKDKNIKFEEQLYAPVVFRGKVVGKNYFDFLIEGKTVLELKKGDRIHKSHIEQVYRYLVVNNLKLGLLAYFSPGGLRFKRVVNLTS